LIDTSAENQSKSEETIHTNVKNELQVSSIEISKPESNSKSHIPSPSARKIIAENNLEISNIIGSGKDGRVTKDDALTLNHQWAPHQQIMTEKKLELNFLCLEEKLLKD